MDWILDMGGLSKEAKAWLAVGIAVTLLGAYIAWKQYHVEDFTALVHKMDYSSLKAVESSQPHLQRTQDIPKTGDIRVSATVK